jgi:hypothetical protein
VVVVGGAGVDAATKTRVSLPLTITNLYVYLVGAEVIRGAVVVGGVAVVAGTVARGVVVGGDIVGGAAVVAT